MAVITIATFYRLVEYYCSCTQTNSVNSVKWIDSLRLFIITLIMLLGEEMDEKDIHDRDVQMLQQSDGMSLAVYHTVCYSACHHGYHSVTVTSWHMTTHHNYVICTN